MNSPHQSNMSTTVVVEDGDDGVSKLDVSAASVSSVCLVTTNAASAVATGELSSMNWRILTVWDFEMVERNGF
jgi:hypothetical protein